MSELCTMPEDWYATWFNTPYYHLLYGHRDENEAVPFIRSLLHFLQIPHGATALDVACGSGRHSRALQREGMRVTGMDLSDNSIALAKQLSSDNIRYLVHDMRLPLDGLSNQFDIAFNLFTSFGYFDNAADDQQTLNAIFQSLKPGGWFVQDYLNARPVISQLPCSNTEEKGHVRFDIHKAFEPPFITKKITITDNDTKAQYCEQVRVFLPQTLEKLHKEAGLEPLHIFGSYDLAPFQEDRSPRIIIASQKALNTSSE